MPDFQSSFLSYPLSNVPDARFSFLQARLAAKAQAGLYRSLEPHPMLDDTSAAACWISLCSNDYLGLKDDPRVIRGAHDALTRWGAGSGSARLIAGNLPLYEALEAELADFFGFESALIFPSGYQANIGLLGAIPGAGGRILSDSLNHASIIDGCKLSRASVQVFPHNHVAAVERLLTEPSGSAPASLPTVVATEGLFSMDGDLAPVEALSQLCKDNNALLLVDDAHAIGALGIEGRGTAWRGAPNGSADVLVGTFGKSFGSAGAFVAGPRIVRESLINLARTFIFTTAPSPASIGAARAALDILRTDPEPQSRLMANVRLAREALKSYGFKLEPSAHHIIPLVVGSETLAVQFADRLRASGIFVRAIRPPTVPPGSSRLRLTISAAHDTDALATAIDVVGRVAKELEVQR